MTAAVIDRHPAPRRAATYRPARPTPRPTSRRVFVARRLVVAALAAALLTVALAVASSLDSQASSDAGTVYATVVVGPGETVWDIARDYVPTGVSPQAYVAEVLRHNDVDPAAVTPGTALQLPRP